MPKSSLFDLDEGFEENPVVQAPVQAVNKVANTGTKYTKQQAAAMAKSFVSQLYGSSTPAATVDDDDQQQDATINAAAKVQKAQTPAAAAPTSLSAAHITQHSVQSTTAQQANTPEEQERIAEARRQLHQHSTEYYDPTFGNISDVEADIRKEAQKREQAEQERNQEVEQEKQQLAELEERKKKEPVDITRARNKAESNRGASG